MDRVTFDKEGYMSVEVTDTPQRAPLADNDVPDVVPVTINKVRAMNALSKVSSEKPGFYGSYAVDDFSGTVWMPAEDDKTPSLLVELSPATRFDVTQLFTVSSARVMFGAPSRGFGFGGPAKIYQYRLEVSMDGEHFTTVVDRTKNSTARDTVFDEFEPVECRFVKLTVTGWPEGSPLGIIDFTAFGYASGEQPAAIATPTFYDLPADSADAKRTH